MWNKLFGAKESAAIESLKQKIATAESRIKEAQQKVVRIESDLSKAKIELAHEESQRLELSKELSSIRFTQDKAVPTPGSSRRIEHKFSDFYVEQFQVEDQIHLVIKGELPGELLDLLKIPLPSDLVNLHFDMQFIGHFADGVGIRDFAKAMREFREVRKYSITFYNCSVSAIDRFEFHHEIALGTKLESFYAPYMCESCDREYDKLIMVSEHKAIIMQSKVPEVVCQCGQQMELNALPERFFSIIHRFDLPNV